MEPVTIRVQPIFGAEPLVCITNVAKRVKACGGRATFGWHVKLDPNIPEITYHASHVVWEAPDGELVCVTPQPVSACLAEWPETIQFLRDDTATFTTEEGSLPSRYVSSDPRFSRAGEYMRRADIKMRSGDLDGCGYWTNRANAELHKHGIRGGWDSPLSLDIADIISTML